ncbi:rod shape-determining protein MreD [Candidatus Desantisbacteria bacterium]|nr:rod shape-determining protein MreD [Candidatus Desantisbacteria bacterium]
MILIIIGILIQATVLTWFDIHHVKPDFILVLVVSVSLLEGSEKGMTFGFLAGLAEDILCGGMLGLNAFARTLTGFIIGIFNKNFYNINKIIQSIIAFISTLLYSGIVYLLLKIFGSNISFSDTFVYILFPGTFYNIILILISFPKINKWLSGELFDSAL